MTDDLIEVTGSLVYLSWYYIHAMGVAYMCSTHGSIWELCYQYCEISWHDEKYLWNPALGSDQIMYATVHCLMQEADTTAVFT